MAIATPPAPPTRPPAALTVMAFAPKLEWVVTLTAEEASFELISNSPSFLTALAVVLFLPIVALTVPSATAMASEPAMPAVEPTAAAMVAASTLL